MNGYLCHIYTGEFGVVYKAKLGPLGPNRRVVAVKTLKGLLLPKEKLK